MRWYRMARGSRELRARKRRDVRRAQGLHRRRDRRRRRETSISPATGSSTSSRRAVRRSSGRPPSTRCPETAFRWTESRCATRPPSARTSTKTSAVALRLQRAHPRDRPPAGPAGSVRRLGYQYSRSFRFAGEWDTMGSTNTGAHFLAWHKWKLGWIDQTQLTCLRGSGEVTTTISPAAATGGSRRSSFRPGRRLRS